MVTYKRETLLPERSNMARKRSNGEGTLRHRSDGRWESASTIGYKPNGKPDRKYFYGKTQKEVKEKVAEWHESQKQKSASGILKIDLQHAVLVIKKLLAEDLLAQELCGAVQNAGVLFDFHTLKSVGFQLLHG